jgi:hypothetical protein
MVNATPSLPPGKRLSTHVQEAVSAPGPSGEVRKISPLAGFDPRTVQPVAYSLVMQDIKRLNLKPYKLSYLNMILGSVIIG